MDYIYEIDLFTNIRRFRATYIEQASERPNDFQTTQFAPPEILADSYHMFIVSYLDNLVHLFTAHDPAKTVHTADIACEHDDVDSCICSPVSIPVPPSLAFHAHILRERLGDLDQEFATWTRKDGSKEHYRYRLPSGERMTTTRMETPDYPGSDWLQADAYHRDARRKVLEEWYQQGITLYQAQQPRHRLAPMSEINAQ